MNLITSLGKFSQREGLWTTRIGIGIRAAVEIRARETDTDTFPPFLPYFILPAL